MKSYSSSALCVVALAISGIVHSAVFTGLGEAVAEISPDGSFVFNSTSRWTAAGGWETWDAYTSGTLTGGVSAVSFDGSVVAGTAEGTAYRWTASSGMTSIGASPSGFSTGIVGISADGNVLAGTRREDLTGSIQAFRWTPITGVVDLGTAGATFANNISPDGSVVVGADTGQPLDFRSGYWLADGTWVGLSASLNAFVAPSADGSVIATENFSGRAVFLWTEADGFSDLGDPIGFPTRQSAFDISYDGSIVVGGEFETIDDGLDGAWIWDALNGRRSVRDLLVAEGVDLTGWELVAAESISADGSVITGFGIGPNGVREAWIADFSAVPLPAAVWLFGSGLLGLLSMAGRKLA